MQQMAPYNEVLTRPIRHEMDSDSSLWDSCESCEAVGEEVGYEGNGSSLTPPQAPFGVGLRGRAGGPVDLDLVDLTGQGQREREDRTTKDLAGCRAYARSGGRKRGGIREIYWPLDDWFD